MKTCIYPGSFDPWHEGHEDTLNKALKVFDHVIIAIGDNGTKVGGDVIKRLELITSELHAAIPDDLSRITIVAFKGFLSDYVRENKKIMAVVRGIRGVRGYEDERDFQYWNEDLGLDVPFCFFLSDRSLVHYSSTAVREIHKHFNSSGAINDKHSA